MKQLIKNFEDYLSKRQTKDTVDKYLNVINQYARIIEYNVDNISIATVSSFKRGNTEYKRIIRLFLKYSDIKLTARKCKFKENKSIDSYIESLDNTETTKTKKRNFLYRLFRYANKSDPSEITANDIKEILNSTKGENRSRITNTMKFLTYCKIDIDKIKKEIEGD